MIYGHAIEAQCTICSILSAAVFSLAFLCYTFAAAAMFPVGILLLLSLAIKKFRPFLKPSLICSAVYALLLSLIVLWRWNDFGWSIFNDYPTDWRFDIASTIWAGRWSGLTDIWGLGIALIVPGLIIVAQRPRRLNELGPIWIYGAIFCACNLLLWVFNPVNHFPRVLLPMLPFVAMALGATLDKMITEKTHLGQSVAWLGATVFAFFHGYLYLQVTSKPLWLFDPTKPGGIGLIILAITILTVIGLFLFRPLGRVRSAPWTVPMLIIIVAVTTGPIMAARSISDQAEFFQSRIELVRTANVQSLMGGGDFQAIGHMSAKTVPWILDLTSEEMDQILAGNLLAVCKNRGISHVIVPKGDPEGTLEMLAGMAMEKGMDIRDIGRIYRPLLDLTQAARIADNHFGALYQIWAVPPTALPKFAHNRLKAYDRSYEPQSDLLRIDANGTSDKVVFEYTQSDRRADIKGLSVQLGTKTLDPKMIQWENRDNQTVGTLPKDQIMGKSLIVEVLTQNLMPFRQTGILIAPKPTQAKTDEDES
jgi:hypothetical protein